MKSAKMKTASGARLLSAPKKLTRKQMEARRLKYSRLLIKGVSLAEVARRAGVSTGTTWNWKEIINKHGLDGLLMTRGTGRPPSLDSTQLEKAANLYRNSKENMTLAKCAEAIFNQFGVKLGRNHLGLIFRTKGITKPRQQAAC